MIYRLKDIGQVITGKTPSTNNKDNFDTNKNKYLFITPRDMNINSKYIKETERYLTDRINSSFNNLIVNDNEICVSCIGTIGKVFIPKYLAITNQQINSIINIDAEICYYNYLYYKLCTLTDTMNLIAGGTTVPIINKSTFENLEIDLPDIDYQRKASKILSDIDNKIEANNEINNNLHELINSLYKEKFSNVDCFKRADEIANITIGKTPPRSEHECFTTNNEDMKWISISDLGKCGMYIYDTNEKLTDEAVDKYNVKVVPENTILLSFKLTVGRTAITPKKMTTNEAIAHFNLNDNDYIYYVYSYLNNFDYSKLGSTSSIATAVNSKIIKAMNIGVPKREEILEYNKIVKPLFNKIKINEEENINLSNLRDTLLPKLMNGEIDLDNIEI
jgi:type I restriction enzyme S subunit